MIFLSATFALGCSRSVTEVDFNQLPELPIKAVLPAEPPNTAEAEVPFSPKGSDRSLCIEHESDCVCSDTFCQPAFGSRILEINSDLRNEMTGVSWKEGCPLSFDELRLLKVRHWDYQGKVRWGELVLASEVVADIESVFKDIYLAKFPIESMKRIDAFGGNDDKSMIANNTSAFNCRNIKGTKRWSQHSYGRAIDINPFVNPWVLGNKVEPPSAIEYADRSKRMPGMIFENDAVVKAFQKIGWTWGGRLGAHQGLSAFFQKRQLRFFYFAIPQTVVCFIGWFSPLRGLPSAQQ